MGFACISSRNPMWIKEPLSPFEVKLEVLADGLPLHAEVHVRGDVW